MMKGSHGSQVSPYNKGLFLEGNWFIILCFRLRSCYGSRLCTHPPRYASVCSFCQNSMRWEYRFPVEIPRVLLFDQSKPMTLLFCTPIWFGAFTSSPHLRLSVVLKVIIRFHVCAHFKKLQFSIFPFAHGLRNATERTARALPPTFRRVILPDDAGVRTTDRLAHEIDVTALIDCDILGHVGDPGGY